MEDAQRGEENKEEREIADRLGAPPEEKAEESSQEKDQNR
jgi:hypothetical protein